MESVFLMPCPLEPYFAYAISPRVKLQAYTKTLLFQRPGFESATHFSPKIIIHKNND